eukprot:PITA_34321
MIVNLESPKNVKQRRATLGHTVYYRKFIKSYAQITMPMEKLSKNDVLFFLDEQCQQSLDVLKDKMVTVPIELFSDWKKEFHVHVDASCIALGVNAKGWRWSTRCKIFDIICWTLTSRCIHITPLSKINKLVLWGKIYRWLLLFQEYDFEVIVKPRQLNAGPDHLSRIETGEEPTNLEEGLPDVKLFAVCVADDHFAYIIQFLTTGITPKGYSTEHKKELVVRAADFSIIARHLYKMGTNEILRRYVLDFDRASILAEAHGGVAGGNYAGSAIVQKILRAGLCWLIVHKDSKTFCKTCDAC